MTKLNNLTNGKMVLSSVIFDVGNQDETKTVITNTNHIQYIHIYKHCIKKHIMLDKSVVYVLRC